MADYEGSQSWSPPEVDREQPSAARVYDYHLGGGHNFPVDRALAQQAAAAFPDLPAVLRAGRAFLRRAVDYLVGEGITQFLDLGSGIPTVGNVHEIAQRRDPRCRVVYVDIDPVAVAHGRAILAGNDKAAAVLGDVRKPDQVFAAVGADPKAGGLLDLSQPVGILIVAVLHFIRDDEDPAGIVASYVKAAAPGSYLALSHGTPQETALQAQQNAADEYARGRIPFYARPRDQITALFTGLDLVSPGIVFTTQWRPDGDGDEFGGDHQRAAALAGVGRLR